MSMQTSMGIFAEWIVGQIPLYIDKKISTKVKNVKSGKDGQDGVSVVGADIAPDEHLVLNLSNGNIIDAGKLPKAKAAAGKDRVHVSGNAFQVTVSATAPSNPAVNDLWLDIS